MVTSGSEQTRALVWWGRPGAVRHQYSIETSIWGAAPRWTDRRTDTVYCNATQTCLRHTCNVTAYRIAVTLQVTDTLRSCELNFHPVPHGVTVSCERYTLGFPVCYRSPSDVFAASSGFLYLYTLRFKEERTVVTCHVALPHLLRP